MPKTQEDADRVKFAVYSTKGIRGIYVSEDDTAALVNAGFWEEDLDVDYLQRPDERAEGAGRGRQPHGLLHRLPVAADQRSCATCPRCAQVFLVTCAALTFLLWNYFRSWPGVWVPMFSGVLSAIWALGLVPLLGLNLDPLILVVPVFLSARALSHSVQSMDRYHEEYHRTHDKHTAIVESYSHLFPPAIASILNDAAGIFLVTMAPIPLIQKVALFSCFWIFSILISVVTLHPIILSATNPPGVQSTAPRVAPLARASGARCPGARLRGLRPQGSVRPHGSASASRGSCVLGVMAWLYRWHEQIYAGHHRPDHRRQRGLAEAGRAWR